MDSRSPLQMASPMPRRESMTFPPPISSNSLSSSWSQAIPLPRAHHNRSNPRTTHKKHKMAQAKLAATSTKPPLLSKSAPATSNISSFSRMTFKPRQPPARAVASAALAEREVAAAASRVRKDRSESSTPGPVGVGIAGVFSHTTPTPGDIVGAGKRVKM